MNIKKEEARRLRKEEGKSVKAIARELGVAFSTISLWVRDVVLTEEQMAELSWRGNHSPGQKKASIASVNIKKDKRIEWQKEGRLKYQQEDKEYALGCALYWGEGSKSRNAVKICNTDSKMLVFFVWFLKKYFDVKKEEFVITVNCYLNNGLTLEEIQNYWLKLLGLPPSSIRKATIKSKYYTGESSGKHPYGVCAVMVYRTEIVQKIYGSINESIHSLDDWGIDF